MRDFWHECEFKSKSHVGSNNNNKDIIIHQIQFQLPQVQAEEALHSSTSSNV